jgi:hypothetical protein
MLLFFNGLFNVALTVKVGHFHEVRSCFTISSAFLVFE